MVANLKLKNWKKKKKKSKHFSCGLDSTFNYTSINQEIDWIDWTNDV